MVRPSFRAGNLTVSEGSAVAKARQLICAAGVLCLGLAGCAGGDRPWDNFSVGFLATPQNSRERAVAGSLDDVSLAAQTTLRRANLQIQVTQDDGVVRIASATRSGRSFTLILTEEKKDLLPYTHVRMQWNDSAEDETGFALLSQIEVSPGK